MATFLTTEDEEEEFQDQDTHEAIFGHYHIEGTKQKLEPEPEPEPKPPDKPPEDDDEEDEDSGVGSGSTQEQPSTEAQPIPASDVAAPTVEAYTGAAGTTQLSDQQRIDRLAQGIRDFRIVTSGQGAVLGGFGKVPYNEVTMEHLESAFEKFSLVGTDGVHMAGSLETGYTLSNTFSEGAASVGFPGGVGPPLPPPPPTETCCPTTFMSAVGTSCEDCYTNAMSTCAGFDGNGVYGPECN